MTSARPRTAATMVDGDVVTLPDGSGERTVDRIIWARGVCGSQIVVLCWREGGSLRCLAWHELPVARP